MPAKRKAIYLPAVTLGAALLCGALTLAAPARAQAPISDPYEPNDTPLEASTLPGVVELPNLTIYPAGDRDYFRLLATPGDYAVQVIATPGLDLTLTVYDPSLTAIASDNDPGGPNALARFSVTAENYYIVGVVNGTALEGFYLFRLTDVTPTLTPVPTATSTPQPTATPPYPTHTPTPDQGGPPDYAEPNYDFAHAYRIVPGDVLASLNFNSGVPGQPDNDFFVMAVRAGITYTCETRDLGPSVDTNLILYWSASFEDVIGGNDDEDTQAGRINSRLTFTSQKEGDIYILAGYKYPETEDIPFPGAATYTLTCFTSSPTPTPTVRAAQGGGWTITPQATPLSIKTLRRPERLPTATPAPVVPQTVDVLVGYDRNDNGEVDPNEGVQGLSVRVIDTVTNRELTHGFTDVSGTVRFIVVTAHPIRVVIQYLGAAENFRPGSPAQWTLLIPASNAPGLIP